MTRNRCRTAWPGPCPRGLRGDGAAAEHHCARPLDHLEHGSAEVAELHMCYCGAKPPTAAADQPDQLALLFGEA